MNEQDDPRIYFASERTFLAWIRTGLALMGVGFAVARFGLFLREMSYSSAHSAIPARQLGISVPAGVALVVLGVVVLLLACLSHIRTTRQLREGVWVPGRISREAVVLAVLLAITGVAMAVYLLLIH
jgi:putative membrane protein